MSIGVPSGTASQIDTIAALPTEMQPSVQSRSQCGGSYGPKSRGRPWMKIPPPGSTWHRVRPRAVCSVGVGDVKFARVPRALRSPVDQVPAFGGAAVARLALWPFRVRAECHGIGGKDLAVMEQLEEAFAFQHEQHDRRGGVSLAQG